MTFIIGLTGGIATGKSTAASQLRRLGLLVFDADAAVHKLMRENAQIIAAIQAAFPQAIERGGINRQTLGNLVFADAAAMHTLEQIIHPAVLKLQGDFIRSAMRRRIARIVLDVPLLFETGSDAACDAVWLIDCPAFLQQQRVMRRAGMTQAKWQQIHFMQMPQAQKRKRSDAIIHSGLGKGAMMRQIKQLLGRK